MTEPNTAKGGLWARLFGATDDDDTKPDEPVQETPIAVTDAPPGPEVAEPVVEEIVVEDVAPIVEEEPPVVETVEEPVAAEPCPACSTPRKGSMSYCEDCGYMFPANGAMQKAQPASTASTLRDTPMAATPKARLQNRYELGALLNERLGISRYQGTDHTTGLGVVIVAAPAPEAVAIVEEMPVEAILVEDDIMPGFDDEIPMATAVAIDVAESWPSLGWEKALLAKVNHPAFPKVLDQFTEETTEYLVLESPLGESLWDAWDDPDGTAKLRYGWLQQLATALEALHKADAILEGIRPDVVVVGSDGHVRITDLSDLLPLPLPANAPIKATLYTAPELILSPQEATTRSDLYSFGAMIYSLEYLHHPLEEKDFERQFTPLQITERFPDVHPLFLRLINKTFTRDLHMRFPTDEMMRTDPSGFHELIRTLAICGKAFDEVRLDVAAWTTTGMIRTGNEDALTVLHGVDTRQDELSEYAMVLLCDGMGGYDAGEVAAAITLDEMRKYLLAHPIFAGLVGKEPPQEPVDPKKYQDVLRDALKHANKEVYTAARTPGKGKRGMGCTAECVYIDSRNVIAGHVGDSRVYHLHRGRLIQLTRDQTLVNRLVELGQLTAEEAEDHPRKNELQQAIGGQPDVMPGTYAGKLMRGDWVLVCSDGLSNHITNKELETMLTREAANSAEEAARRLLNLVNLRGATDNATIVVVRAS
jgi:serine/threonine protein phosphatase PrpC